VDRSEQVREFPGRGRTSWLDFEPLPVAIYGVVLLACGAAFTILLRVLVRALGTDTRLRDAVASDLKGRLSLVFYAAGIALALSIPLGCAGSLRRGRADVADPGPADRNVHRRSATEPERRA
jgi:hypothetical protein